MRKEKKMHLGRAELVGEAAKPKTTGDESEMTKGKNKFD
jgi:hypothetical protein